MADWLTVEQRSRNMAAIRSSGTKPEAKLGLLLRAMFPRRKIADHPALVGKPDYSLPGLRLVVFADGCFWHGCRTHGRIPEDNRDYWEPKIKRNQARGRRVVRELRQQGFTVVRVWDHELKDAMAPARRKIRRALSERN